MKNIVLKGTISEVIDQLHELQREMAYEKELKILEILIEECKEEGIM